MSPVKNVRVLFNEPAFGPSSSRHFQETPSLLTCCPQYSGLPEQGKTTVYDESQTIDLDAVPLDGGCLVKALVLSVDPYMRIRMRDPSEKSYNVGSPSSLS